MRKKVGQKELSLLEPLRLKLVTTRCSLPIGYEKQLDLIMQENGKYA